MTPLSDIKALIRRGRYELAFTELSASNEFTEPALVVRVQLLEKTGRIAECKGLLSRLNSAKLSTESRATCELTSGMIAFFFDGDSARGVKQMRHAAQLFEHADALPELCWAQIHLFNALSSVASLQESTKLVETIRRNANRVGDSQVIAGLHIFVGAADAKRGLYDSGLKHLQIGLRLLKDDENAWLEVVAENGLAAIALMTSDYECALAHSKRASTVALESCSVRWSLAPLGNIGNVYYKMAEFDQAKKYLESARAAAPGISESRSGALDTLACVFMQQDDFENAKKCFDQVRESVRDTGDWLVYPLRFARLNMARLLVRQGYLPEALADASAATELSQLAEDSILYSASMLVQADVLRRMNRREEFADALLSLSRVLHQVTPECLAEYHAVLGSDLRQSPGERSIRLSYFERARRLYRGVRNKSEELGIERLLASESGPIEIDDTWSTRAAVVNILQDVVSLLRNTQRHELVALGMLEILKRTDAALETRLVTRAYGTADQVASGEPATDSVIPVALTTSSIHQHVTEILISPKRDTESIAAINAVCMLAAVVRQLECARVEQEHRMTPWPIDDLPLESGDAIVGGQMRDVMVFARRVANTNVCVLITGESGTGKEILARAIHHYSPRSNKPFIPFNCTAVPRDMLESQMFGHRRGAFTGADRDYPGLIRAAKDGTLFLDEVGELGLDLQPKLLRFLESGEISPLGESGPLHIDVRIVAATNRNLEDLVQEGRFREDLYYRLNVVRLTIPPLRERRDEIPALVNHFVLRAAAEFKKGRIRVAEETMEYLLLHHWPGNVRELNNEIRRMVALADPDAVLEPAALSAAVRKAAKAAKSTNGDLSISLQDKLAPTIARIEREMIERALRTHHGRVEAAARALGISRKGLYLKRQRLGL